MKTIEIFIRSLLFNAAFFCVTLAMMICAFPTVFMKRERGMAVVYAWVKTVYVLEKTLLGLDYEVRGRENVPQGQAFLLAAKHQSAYETMKLHLLLGDPAIVLKRELLSIPMWGRFLNIIDPVAIDRGNREEAMKSLLAGVQHVKDQGRPIVIFPQGTRVMPDAVPTEKPYKVGIGRMYVSSGLAIVPLALNSGIFWPRHSWFKRPGKVVFEFLPPIAAGLPITEVMAMLQDRLEDASNALTAEARAAYPWLPRA